ncbi:MAG: TetR/AcrR family transcriptional regulator [Ilumatobacteraceae bacterium]
MATSTEPAPRQRYARGEGDKLRLDLLHAAAELMATHGTLDGISLRAVAREAGVSPTAVYRHFDDHLALLRESVAQCWANFYRAMRDARDSSDDPFVAFRATGEAYVRFAMMQPGQYRVLFSNTIDLDMSREEIHSLIDAPDDVTDSGMATFEILVDLVADMLSELHDDRDPFFVAVQVFTWIHGIVDLCGTHPDTPWPEVPDLLDGLRAALRLTPPA